MRRRELNRAAVLAVSLALAVPRGAHAHPGHDERREQLSARIAASPADAEAFLARAELHRQHDEPDAALADYASARRLDPSLTVVDLCLGQLYLEQGQPALALRHLDSYLARHPDHGDAHALRGRAKRERGDAEGAADDFSAALACAARPSPDLWIERARALASLDGARIDEALTGLDEGILRLGPVVSLQVEAVDLALAAGRIDEALRRLEGLATAAARPESWILRRAEVLDAAARWPEASEAYRATLAAVARLPLRARASLGARRVEERARQGLAALADRETSP